MCNVCKQRVISSATSLADAPDRRRLNYSSSLQLIIVLTIFCELSMPTFHSMGLRFLLPLQPFEAYGTLQRKIGKIGKAFSLIMTLDFQH